MKGEGEVVCAGEGLVYTTAVETSEIKILTYIFRFNMKRHERYMIMYTYIHTWLED